jgi:phage gp36-like protein
MSQPLSIELAASAARVADGSGTAVDLGLVADLVPRSAARLEIAVTAFSDVERLRLAVEHAAAEAGPWLELDFLDVTQTDDYQLSVGDSKRWLRLSWQLVGPGDTPSVTFSVAGEAHQVYLGPKDLKSAIRVVALEEITTLAARADACIAVSDEADGYLGGRYVLPMRKWDNALKAMLARMAVKYSMDACGYQPEGPDSIIKDNFNASIAWLKRLQDGKLEPPGMVDSTPETFEGGSVVVSRPRRSVL